MIYRVIMKVRYSEAWFDFDDAETACSFAQLMLTHQTPNDDSAKTDHVELKVIDTTIKVVEEEED